MPQPMIRVQIHETVTHTFLIEVPTDDTEAIKDAAENIFLMTDDLETLDDYRLEVTAREVDVG